MTATVTAFCERWLDGEYEPGGLITEATARRRDKQGRPYMAVLSRPDEPPTVVAVNWSLNCLDVWFLDDELRRYLVYSFTRVRPDALFLDEITLWEYDPGVVGFDSATKITSFSYTEDGVVREEITDKSTETVEVISTADVNVDVHWEGVPAFGDWSSVMRWDRQASVDQPPRG
jgi:hypothetical protein